MTIPIYLLHRLEHIIQTTDQKPSKTKKISHKKKKVRICSQPEYIFYTMNYLPDDDVPETNDDQLRIGPDSEFQRNVEHCVLA